MSRPLDNGNDSEKQSNDPVVITLSDDDEVVEMMQSPTKRPRLASEMAFKTPDLPARKGRNARRPQKSKGENTPILDVEDLEMTPEYDPDSSWSPAPSQQIMTPPAIVQTTDTAFTRPSEGDAGDEEEPVDLLPLHAFIALGKQKKGLPSPASSTTSTLSSSQPSPSTPVSRSSGRKNLRLEAEKRREYERLKKQRQRELKKGTSPASDSCPTTPLSSSPFSPIPDSPTSIETTASSTVALNSQPDQYTYFDALRLLHEYRTLAKNGNLEIKSLITQYALLHGTGRTLNLWQRYQKSRVESTGDVRTERALRVQQSYCFNQLETIRHKRGGHEALWIMRNILQRYPADKWISAEALDETIKLWRKVESVMFNCHLHVLEECNRIKHQLSTDLLGPQGMTDKIKQQRQLGRVRYHIAKPETDGARPIGQLYEELHRLFVHYDWVPNDELEKTYKEITATLRIMSKQGGESIPGSSQMEEAVEFDPLDSNYPGDEERIEDRLEELQMNAADVDAAPGQFLISAQRSQIEQDILDDLLNQGATLTEAIEEPVVERKVLAALTYAKKCSANCPEFTGEAAHELYVKILKVVQEFECAHLKGLREIVNNAPAHYTKASIELKKSVYPALQKYAPCYAGLRTLATRFRNIGSLTAGFLNTKAITADQNYNNMVDLCANDFGFLKHGGLRRELMKRYPPIIDKYHLYSLYLQNKYLPQMEKIQKYLEEGIERYECDTCDRLASSVQLTKKKINYEIEPFLREGASAPYHVCRRCMRDIRKGTLARPKTPRFSLVNKVGIEKPVDELQGLNFLEHSLIQLARPVKRVFRMSTHKGKPVPLMGTSGPMVMVPISTEATLKHVAETLPSDAELTIVVVAGDAGKLTRLVCLPRVLKALRWLKAHNPEYANININENFQFSQEAVRFVKERGNGDFGEILGTDTDRAELITDDPEDRSLLQHIEAHLGQPVIPLGDDKTALEVYEMQRHRGATLSIDTPNLDVKAFPQYFPTGMYGFNAQRPIPLTTLDLIRWYLSQSDRSLARDPALLAFFQGYEEQKRLTSSLGLMARLARNYTIADFRAAIDSGSAELESLVYKAAQRLRGQLAYWDDVRNRLSAHCALFGQPDFFLTLTPDAKRWPELIEIYKQYFPEANAENIHTYIAKDPYHFSRYFQLRLRAVFDKLILDQAGPLGEVIHFFTRIEYQKNGTPHMHALLWVKDAPQKDAPEDEIFKFLHEKIDSQLPPERDSELYKLVNECQRHNEKHSLTCLRTHQLNGTTFTRCRFGFPRPVCSKPFFNRELKTLQGLPGSRTKPYYLPRGPDDVHINDYNAAILLEWCGNMDIQWISQTGDLVDYMTSYLTKAGDKNEALFDLLTSLRECTDRSEAFKIMIKMMNLRDVGMVEVIDNLLGHELFRFDMDHVFVNTNESDRRSRMLLPKALTRNRNDGRLFCANMADDYYKDRPKELEMLSYLNFCIYYSMKSDEARKNAGGYDADSDSDDEAKATPTQSQRSTQKTQTKFRQRNPNPFANNYHIDNERSPFFDNSSGATAYDLQDTTRAELPDDEDENESQARTGSRKKRLYRRLTPFAPRFYFPSVDPDRPELMEDYYRRLCMMHIPWRDEETLIGDEPSYEERWNMFLETLRLENADAVTDIEKLTEQIDTYLKMRREAAEARRKRKILFKQIGYDEGPEMEDETETVKKQFYRNVDTEQLEEHQNGLNAGQRKIFASIMDTVKRQEQYQHAADQLEKNGEADKIAATLGAPPARIRTFVHGTAGTGKSHLLNTLADRLTLDYTDEATRAAKPAVVIGAPTGLAAVQIGGQTLHSLLKIPVDPETRRFPRPLRSLTESEITELRSLFRNTKLFIYDELSMMSNVMIAKIEHRMRQISGRDELFGGYNLVFMGDLMQLQPPKQKSCFVRLSAEERQRTFGGMAAGIDCFRHLEYSELTENMRQKEDQATGELLQRIRTQNATTADWETLRTRIIPSAVDIPPGDEGRLMIAAAKYFVELRQKDPRAMALWPRVDDVTTFNQLVEELLHLKRERIEAIDVEAAILKQRDPANSKRKSRPWLLKRYRITLMTKQQRRAEQRRLQEDTALRQLERAEALLGVHAADEVPVDEDNIRLGAMVEHNDFRGGLPKILHLAKHGRVMLRRNLDRDQGLVNGAMGTIEDLERDAFGEIVAAIVRFDHDAGKTHRIQKLTVSYDDGNEQARSTRTQFPLLTAYGATVHKCQGLTLDNVLVSTNRIFKEGMGYVALSRVKKLEGLHLVDLQPKKIYCDHKALAVYNNLRAKIGLEPFPSPVRYLGDAAAAIQKQRERQQKAQEHESPIKRVVELMEEAEVPQLSPGKLERIAESRRLESLESPRKRPLRAVAAREIARTPTKLVHIQKYGFLETVLMALETVDELRDLVVGQNVAAIENRLTDPVIYGEWRRIYLKEAKDAGSLGPRLSFCNIPMQLADQLIKSMTWANIERFRTNIEAKCECVNGCIRWQRSESRFLHYALADDLLDADDRTEATLPGFNEILAAAMKLMIPKCPECGDRLLNISEPTIVKRGRYFACAIDKVTRQTTPPKFNINGYEHEKPVNIGGQRMYLIAAIRQNKDGFEVARRKFGQHVDDPVEQLNWWELLTRGKAKNIRALEDGLSSSFFFIFEDVQEPQPKKPKTPDNRRSRPPQPLVALEAAQPRIRPTNPPQLTVTRPPVSRRLMPAVLQLPPPEWPYIFENRQTNACYMNCILQLCFVMEALCQHIQNVHLGNPYILNELRRLMQPNGATKNCQKLRHALINNPTTLGLLNLGQDRLGYITGQQDCCDTLMALLEYLGARHLLDSTVTMELRCNRCHAVRPLPLEQAPWLNSALWPDNLVDLSTLDRQFKEEPVERQCSQCGHPVTAKHLVACELADYLLLRLPTFQTGNDGRSRRRRLTLGIPENYRMTATTAQHGPVEYEIQAFVCHHGETPAAGHYWAVARDDTGTWLKLDDERISRQATLQETRAAAYLVLLKRIEPAPAPAPAAVAAAPPVPPRVRGPSQAVFSQPIVAPPVFPEQTDVAAWKAPKSAEIKPLVRRLWQNDDNLNEVFATVDGERLTRGLLQRLRPVADDEAPGASWLNDIIINCYLSLLSKDSKRKIYVTLTYFYDQLLRKGPEITAQSLRRIELDQLKLLLIPINHQGAHWSLVAVDPMKRSIEAYDSMSESSEFRTGMLQQLKRLFETYSATVLNKPETWNTLEHTNIPQQENGSDCGIFLCCYAIALADGLPMTFGQADMGDMRLRMIWELTNGRRYKSE